MLMTPKAKYTLPISIALGAIFFLAAAIHVQAGSVNDFGQLSGTPAQVNYVAWIVTGTEPPAEVITEDSLNSPGGVNGGYSNDFWILDASQLSGIADGSPISMVIGGLGTASGTLWTYSFNWDDGETNTSHGTLTTTIAGSCPQMTQGSLIGDQKTINWNGPAGRYHIYRAILPSGAPNEASNGVYAYVATVTTSGPTGTYVDTVSGDTWHIVLPAAGDDSISSCHSEESNPTVISLAGLQASSSGRLNLNFLALGTITLILVTFLIFLAKKPSWFVFSKNKTANLE